MPCSTRTRGTKRTQQETSTKQSISTQKQSCAMQTLYSILIELPVRPPSPLKKLI